MRKTDAKMPDRNLSPDAAMAGACDEDRFGLINPFSNGKMVEHVGKRCTNMQDGAGCYG